MKKITLILADNDENYIGHISDFLNSSDFSYRFTLKSFSSKDTLKKFVLEDVSADLLLINPDLYDKSIEGSSDALIVCLVDETKHMEHNQLQVVKYQPLSHLFNQLLRIFQEAREGAGIFKGNKTTSVLAIYSACGGSGKTVLALNLAARIAEQDQRVFYLNLELFNSYRSGNTKNTEQKNGFSKALYYLKDKPDLLANKFESLITTDQSNHFDLFTPLTRMQEILDMNTSDVNSLIEIIANKGLYDLIIIDLESSLHDRITAVLEKSNLVFWLVVDHIQCLQRTEELLKEFQFIYGSNYSSILRKVRFILNKSLNKPANDFNKYGINISNTLPYIPDWKTVFKEQQLVDSSFKQAAGKLYQSECY